MSELTSIDGVDYGPLAVLIGTWTGDRGVDVAPEPDGDERNPYYERIVMEAAGDVTNAESQTLAIVRYHQAVTRKSNDEVFHDQVGYWLWDAADNTIIECFVIPRGVAVVAGGTLAPPTDLEQTLTFEVATDVDQRDYGILQPPFMAQQARTTAFSHSVTVAGDELQYSQTTSLDIYNKRDYPHKDINTLQRNK